MFEATIAIGEKERGRERERERERKKIRSKRGIKWFG
jgi:hypothetical protein